MSQDERASLSRVSASRETSGLMCPWMAPVIATQAWPKTSEITLSGTPADNITEAAECRSVCSPTKEGSPARLDAVFSARNALRRSLGSPQLGCEHVRGRLPDRAKQHPLSPLPGAHVAQHLLYGGGERYYSA
jgi:hypothetical protein